MTLSGDESHDGKFEGATRTLTLEVLALAIRTISSELGLQVKELVKLPIRAKAENLSVRGSMVQVAFGTELEEIPTVAKATTIIRVIETPNKKCGRYRLTSSLNCNSIG